MASSPRKQTWYISTWITDILAFVGAYTCTQKAIVGIFITWVHGICLYVF